MSAVELVLLCTGGFVAVGVLAVGAGRRAGTSAFVYAATLGLSLAALVTSLGHLLSGPDAAPAVVLPLGLPWLGAHFRMDALAAFFLSVVNLGAAAASLYGIGYGRHEEAPGRVLPAFALFVGAMNLVLVADDAFTFLFSWELMSLASWALVLAHHESADNARAGYVYLVMASFGTLALLLGFGLLAGADGDYAFDAIRAAEHGPLTTGLALALVLLGAGSKSGLVPLHAWLPLAHPAAPSHVSALMSGVMTKVAIYGFVRIVFDLIGEPAAWQSMIVLAAGGATAVLGVLYALMQRDLKRLLAYSTVENVGIVYIGLGLALAFAANGFDVAAALALTAALFHVLNHSLFKSLLFFGAGAVLTATGERNMEKLGGLIRRMPATSFVFLVGCVAISALPPLNGFVSEWLTFQAVLQSPDLPQWGLKLMVPAIGGLLALAAALAAACFVRAFGITFLGRPRSPVAEAARDVERSSLAAMIGLAALCVLAGILPGMVIDAVAPITLDLLGGRLPAQADIAWRSIVPVAETESSYSGLLVFVFIAVSAPFAAAVIKRFASNAVRRGPAWDCGFPEPSPLTQYSAGGFEQPIRRVFGTTVFAATERVDMPKPGDLRPARLEVTVRDLIWETLYAPLAHVVGFAADRLNRMQFLTIRRYLSLVFLSLVGLLLVVAIWQT
ncbi:MAG TPA: hydrogenase 4 subunit B [Gammaproteobacteria bacterium]